MRRRRRRARPDPATTVRRHRVDGVTESTPVRSPWSLRYVTHFTRAPPHWASCPAAALLIDAAGPPESTAKPLQIQRRLTYGCLDVTRGQWYVEGGLSVCSGASISLRLLTRTAEAGTDPPGELQPTWTGDAHEQRPTPPLGSPSLARQPPMTTPGCSVLVLTHDAQRRAWLIARVTPLGDHAPSQPPCLREQQTLSAVTGSSARER